MSNEPVQACEHCKCNYPLHDLDCPIAKAKQMVAANNATMFTEVRALLARSTDPEAQRLLEAFDGFLGEGYTGRVMAFKHALEGIDLDQLDTSQGYRDLLVRAIRSKDEMAARGIDYARFEVMFPKFLKAFDKKFEPDTEFDDTRVQIVYELICDPVSPPPGEHWDGFVARRIVDALFPVAGSDVPPGEPTAGYYYFKGYKAGKDFAERHAIDAQEPVGEVIHWGTQKDLKEVSWRKGKMPPSGTLLFGKPRADKESEEI